MSAKGFDVLQEASERLSDIIGNDGDINDVY